MSNELTLLDNAGGMPAHLQAAFGEQQNNDLATGVSAGYPVISFKGKSWSLRENGATRLIMKPDADDEVASAIEVVIVKANPHISKVYYEGGYTEGSDEKPKYYSHNGLTPAADAQEPQCATCAACPHNAWGSRITENGSKGKACSDSRRVAVVPSGELDRPMLLRIPAATLKDLASYGQQLTSRNAPYQAVVTKIGFDRTVAHPKLTFKAIRWLSANEAAKVAETLKSDTVAQIIGADAAGTTAPKAVDAIAHLPPRPAHAEPVKPAPKKAAKPAPEPEEEVEEAPPPKKTKMAAAKAPAKEAPPPSKLSSKIAEASDDLDAALASLDDI